MNLLYLTPNMYLTRRRAGGMRTKTQAIKEAWSLFYNVDIASELDTELINLYDVILIELLGFRKKKKDKFDAQIEALKASPAVKIVYGSDSEIFRWTGAELDALKQVVTAWIPNCPWQADYFMDFDVPVVDVVFEPINTDLFRPSEKQKVILASSAISYEKHSDFFIELFARLKEMHTAEYKTAYVGSAGGWGDLEPANLKLQKELKGVTDDFHGELPPEKVANVFSSTAVAVLNPKYETCNRTDMELMASGVARICGNHVCYDERLTTERFITIDECIEKIKDITSGFTALPTPQHGQNAREYAVNSFSYEATLTQLNEVIQYLR